MSQFELWRLTDWAHRLSTDREGAICEALVRAFLARSTPQITPFEHRATGGPDFQVCLGGESIYIEVTSIGIEALTAATGLTNEEGLRDYRPLTSVMMSRAKEKASQLADLDGARLLFIASLHTLGSCLLFGRSHMEFVLHSTPHLTAPFDQETGEAGRIRQVVGLRDSSFIKPGTGEVALARKSITGIVGCGFGCEPPVLTAVLHPDPVSPILNWPWKEIQVGRLSYPANGHGFEVQWTAGG